jgi:hypothetical protein
VARVLAVVAVVVVLGLAPAAPVPQGVKEVYYYPTRVSDSWVTEQTLGDNKYEWSHAVRKVERKGAAYLVTVETKGGGLKGDNTWTTTMEVSGAGLTRVGVGLPGAKSELVLRVGKEGDTWTDVLKINGREDKLVFTLIGSEEVTVPAGRYKCLNVRREQRSEIGGQTLLTAHTDWYAPGVGMVKSTLSVNGVPGGNTTVLKSFTPAR